MKVIHAHSAGGALRAGISILRTYGESGDSRAGPVVVAPWPVVTITSQPLQRVVFSASRDANPFFHLVEAAWMLAGHHHTSWLLPYVKRFAEFAEPDGTVHGAYGYRWRSHFGFDQLRVVIDKLRANPNDRQAVLAMWDPTDDVEGGRDLLGQWRDRPCNTHVYFRVRGDELTSMVCCRSNDAIWGAHGANAVHFSYLHEYVATAVGVHPGPMHQLSFNYHAYADVLDKVAGTGHDLYDTRYEEGVRASGVVRVVRALPMGTTRQVDDDLMELWPRLLLVHDYSMLSEQQRLASQFGRTVLCAAQAHAAYRAGHYTNALVIADRIEADDWRAACREWIERRVAAKEASK